MDDRHRRVRNVARLQGEPLILVRDAGQAHAQAAPNPERRLRLRRAFAGSPAFGDLAEVVVASGSRVTSLADGDDVDRGVELPITAAGEPVAGLVAAGGVDQSGAGVAGVVALVGKARTSPVSARIFAAVISARPWISVRVNRWR